MENGRRAGVRRATAIAAVIGVSVLAAGGVVVGQIVSPPFREAANRATRVVLRAGRPPAQTTPSPRAARGPTPVRVANLLQQPRPGDAPGVSPQSLTDGLVGERAPAWRTPAGLVQAELRFPVSEEASVGQVVFAHTTVLPEESWAREVEVWVARTADAQGEPDLLGRWTLNRTTGQQVFRLESAAPAARARLRVLSNHGSREFTSLAEFALVPPA